MKKFKIPVSWEVYGYVVIEAETIEEALEYFDEHNHLIDLPTDCDYVDGSFNRDEDIEFIRIVNS